MTGETQGGLEHFGVATFVTARDRRIVDRSKVWTDLNEAPADRRRSNNRPRKRIPTGTQR